MYFPITVFSVGDTDVTNHLATLWNIPGIIWTFDVKHVKPFAAGIWKKLEKITCGLHLCLGSQYWASCAPK